MAFAMGELATVCQLIPLMRRQPELAFNCSMVPLPLSPPLPLPVITSPFGKAMLVLYQRPSAMD